jgi:hypothetical protein
MVKNFCFLLLIFTGVGCKSTTLSGQKQPMEQLVAQQLGTDATIEKNKDQSFALGVKDDLSNQSTTYVIVRISDNFIVEQGKTQKATVYWIDNFRVGVRLVPGTVQKETALVTEKVIDLTKYITKQ